MDCIEAVAEGDRLLLTRPCYGGNARAVVSCHTRPVIAVACDPASAVRTRIIGREQLSSEGVRLEDTDVVVAGGADSMGLMAFACLKNWLRS